MFKYLLYSLLVVVEGFVVLTMNRPCLIGSVAVEDHAHNVARSRTKLPYAPNALVVATSGPLWTTRMQKILN